MICVFSPTQRESAKLEIGDASTLGLCAVSSLLSIRLSNPMPFSRSGPLRGLDAYCKDDELSEIGSQLAEGSINAGTVKPCRNSAFVLLVLAKARP